MTKDILAGHEKHFKNSLQTPWLSVTPEYRCLLLLRNREELRELSTTGAWGWRPTSYCRVPELDSTHGRWQGRDAPGTACAASSLWSKTRAFSASRYLHPRFWSSAQLSFLSPPQKGGPELPERTSSSQLPSALTQILRPLHPAFPKCGSRLGSSSRERKPEG